MGGRQPTRRAPTRRARGGRSSNQGLLRQLDRAYDDMLRLARERKSDLRSAAMMLAIDRVARRTRLRGVFQ